MNAFISVTRRFFAQIWSDVMLAALICVPLVMGMAFRFGVPALEACLCGRFAVDGILAPYYPVFDLLLSIMTPMMFTAAGAMVILDEADAGIARAIAVTPVGRNGYLASRIGVPALLSMGYCVGVLAVFRLTDLDVVRIVLLALCSGALGVVVALLITSFAKNKVEGMALSKLSGLFVLGLPAAILVPAPFKYLAGILPTLWMTELVTGKSLLYVLPALITSALWAALFAKRFSKKILN